MVSGIDAIPPQLGCLILSIRNAIIKYMFKSNTIHSVTILREKKIK